MLGFISELSLVGWDVHTRLDHVDHHATARDSLLHEAAESRSALILKTSHIGGHKYAGNVIVSLISCFVSEG